MGKPRLMVLSFVMITFLFALQGLIPSSGTVSPSGLSETDCKGMSEGKV